MNEPFRIEIDEAQLASVKALLGHIKNGAERAIVRAINKSLNAVKTDFAKVVTADLNVTQKLVKEKINVEKPNFGKLLGAVSRTGKPLPLLQFIGTNQKITGVSVKVKRAGDRSTWKHTFITKFKSGHEAVVWRETGYVGKGKRKTPAPWLAKAPKKYRLPIKELFGPRIEDILGKTENISGITNRGGENFTKYLEHEIDYLLKSQLATD